MKILKSIIFWLLLAVFLKQILWVGIVPLWHFPDEQAHFGQIQNIAEKGFEYSNSSDEIALSEKFLQTFRYEQGRNSFTLQPWFRIPYTDNVEGVYEQQIKNLPKETRTFDYMNLREATSYPFLYYWLASLAYKLFYNSDLITRVFAIRLLSSVLFTINIWLVYLIGRCLNAEWRKLNGRILRQEKELFPLVLAVMVGFHPMLSFVGASPNSDVLFNLLFTLFIYGGLVVISDVKHTPADGLSLSRRNFNIRQILNSKYGWIIVFASIILGLFTKQQMVIAFAIVPLILLFKINEIKEFFLKNRFVAFGILIFFGIGIYVATQIGEIGRILGFVGDNFSHKVNILEHIKWSLEVTYRQTLPWYWGVFRWLSLTLPRWVNRIQMSLLLISGIGIGLHFIDSIWRNYLLTDKKDPGSGLLTRLSGMTRKVVKDEKNLLFMIYCVVIYFLAIIIWDWLHRMGKGFSFGVQGRYFFPVITAHMSILLIGFLFFGQFVYSRAIKLVGFCNHRKTQISYGLKITLIKLNNYLLSIIGVWFVILNSIAIWTVSNSYFDHSNMQSFIIQVSQYKPLIFKSSWWYLWLGVYLLSSIFVLFLIVRNLGKIKNDKVSI